MNLEERCHSFISALFELQDRWKRESDISNESFRQIIKGDDRYTLNRNDSYIWLIDKHTGRQHYSVRVTTPEFNIPSILKCYLHVISQ